MWYNCFRARVRLHLSPFVFSGGLCSLRELLRDPRKQKRYGA
jgi:hypothetical protein